MQINVNGKNYEVPDGCSVNIVDDNIFVNGQTISVGPGLDLKAPKIEIIGNIGTLQVKRGDVSVKGNTEEIDAGGNVTVSGEVKGEIDAGGNVTCGNVTGDVDAGGNVVCGNVSGSVDAGGNIISKR